MITHEQAKALPHGGTVYHLTWRQGRKGAEPLRVRKSGQVRTWADGTWRMPIKWGLYESAYIGTRIEGTHSAVHAPSEWTLTQPA